MAGKVKQMAYIQSLDEHYKLYCSSQQQPTRRDLASTFIRDFFSFLQDISKVPLELAEMRNSRTIIANRPSQLVRRR